MFEHRPFGERLRLRVSGASHAPCIRFELDGFPAGFRPDPSALRRLMERRAPGRDALSTSRREPDEVEFTAGLRDGLTTGGPIVGRIANTDTRPFDYGAERTVPRPGHADFGQWVELGRIPTGGGANSGRLTAALCAAGGLCLQWLAKRGVEVAATLDRIAGCDRDFESSIAAARADGDSVGGTIRCRVTGLRAGLGGALFAGVESRLSAAIFAIPGVKGIEFGNGFAAADLRGSENDDAFEVKGDEVVTATNRHGGILGGRTSGMPLTFRLVLKPTPTVFKALPSVDLTTRAATELKMKGRHDPCIVRRALPVVEAVTAFALADLLLDTEAATPRICLTLTGKTLDEDWRQFSAQRLFVDLLELRVDLLAAAERGRIRELIARAPVPVIVTFRKRCDGGAFDGPESVREDFFRELLSNPLPAAPEVLVDFEDDFRVGELTQLAAAHQVRIIRSKHIFEGSVPNSSGSVPNWIASCRTMVEGTNEIAKVAVFVKNADDLIDFLDSAAALSDVPHVVCAMGAVGQASRVLAVRTGSLWSYASVSGLAELGHLTPQEMVRDYRLRVQTAEFDLFGVTGWPLLRTRSPELHNAAFLSADRDAVMASFPLETAEEVVTLVRRLGLKGMAVTIPHKQSVMPLLDELTDAAREIGAVNTIVCRDGRLIGANTDAGGFAEALSAFLGRDRLDGLRAAVLGAGGASKAVVYALTARGADVEVFHRRTPGADFDLLVNATPVDPIPDYVFSGREAVYDLRYLPAETPLMARARAAGCKVENGLSMLKAQARLQRELWGAR